MRAMPIVRTVRRALPARPPVHPLRALAAPRLRVLGTAEAAGAGAGGRRTELAVEGLVCGLCARRAERALRRAPGVRGARVDLARGRAAIVHRGPAPPPPLLAAALERAVVAPGWRRRAESWARRARRALRFLRRAGGRA